MKIAVEGVAAMSLAFLVTGCPLTDDYQLLQEDAGGGGGRGSLGGETSVAGAGRSSLAGAPNSASGAGGSVETAGAGTSGDVCSKACSPDTACVANSCHNGWVTMAAPPTEVVARSKAASVAMGRAAFIWGGLNSAGVALNNGAIYDPRLDEWIYLPPDPGSPSARIMATAVWTGSASNKVIVYGGTDASGLNTYKDGAIYDALENSWAALPANPMTGKRSAPFGYWDGTRAVFFGGFNGALTVAGADRFDLKMWSVSAGMGDPGPLGYSAIAVDGMAMYVQGGVIGTSRQDKVYSYSSSTDKWTSLSKGPSARAGAFGAWDGTRFVVWGGQDDGGLRDDGKTMSGKTWSDMIPSDSLSARRIAFRRSGWAFQTNPGVVAFIGGQTSISSSTGTLATDGASYAVESEEWTTIPSWPSSESHEYGIGVWTGEEFVLWGGRNQNLSTLTGEIWAP